MPLEFFKSHSLLSHYRAIAPIHPFFRAITGITLVICLHFSSIIECYAEKRSFDLRDSKSVTYAGVLLWRIVDGKCTACMDINFAVKFIHLCVHFSERNIIQVNRHGKCAMKEIFIPHGYLSVRPILLALFIYIYSDLFRFRWFSMFCVCCVCSLGC